MADMRNFTRKYVLEFIELYRSLPCLWKINSKEYSDRDKKHLAYGKLIDKLREQIPEADRNMVVKKLDSIRGSFRKEWKKVNNSKKSVAANEVYKPRLWYFNELTFLKANQLSKTNVTSKVTSSKCEQESTSELSSTPPPPSPSKPRASTFTSTTSLRKPSNKRKKSLLCDIILKKVNEKLDSEGQEDYYDVVAKHLASKLRKLPEDVAKVTEKLLFDLVYEADLGYVDRQTKLKLVRTEPLGQSEYTKTSSAEFDDNGQIEQQNSSSLEYLISYKEDEGDRKADISSYEMVPYDRTKQEL